MTNTDLLGSQQAASIIGIDRATFNRWALAGRISPAVTMPGLTGARLFARADVEALVSERDDAEKATA